MRPAGGILADKIGGASFDRRVRRDLGAFVSFELCFDRVVYDRGARMRGGARLGRRREIFRGRENFFTLLERFRRLFKSAIRRETQ
jgi:hypothetical protein